MDPDDNGFQWVRHRRWGPNIPTRLPRLLFRDTFLSELTRIGSPRVRVSRVNRTDPLRELDRYIVERMLSPSTSHS